MKYGNNKFSDFVMNNNCERMNIMEEKQTINCTVESCAYQDGITKKCTLQAISVIPTENCDTCETDESMCGSYEYAE